MEDENNETKRRSSELWQYFDDVLHKKWIAKCKQCNKSLSYKSGTCNLKKHLTRKHSDEILVALSDGDEGDAEEEVTFLEEEEDEEQETEISFDKRKILRNGAWEYFEVHDEDQKMATCTLCREQFSYRTTSTNLAKHLKRRHCIEFEKVTEEDYSVEREVNEHEEVNLEDDEDSGDKDTSKDNRRSRTSIAWEFFTIKDHQRRLATCKLCESQFSYLTSVSNLMKHVRKRHGVKTKEEDHHYEEDDEKQESLTQTRSSVWLYFKCIDNVAKVSMCLICKKQLSHLTSITNLKKHLYRKHPGVQLHAAANGKKMLLADDGQLYEIEDAATKQERPDDSEQTEPLEMSAIYLDDYPPPRRRRRHSDSDDSDTFTFHKKYVRKKNDSLDQFGRYLVSLLQQLPRAQSHRLQAEFVRQAVAACEGDPPPPAEDQ